MEHMNWSAMRQRSDVFVRISLETQLGSIVQSLVFRFYGLLPCLWKGSARVGVQTCAGAVCRRTWTQEGHKESVVAT